MNDRGTTLLELMIVVFIIAVMASMGMPLLQQQYAIRVIESIARRFILHAQFARQQALHLGTSIRITPLEGNNWNSGWIVGGECREGGYLIPCDQGLTFSQGAITPIYFKGVAKQWNHQKNSQNGITFNAAGAAKTSHGGFLASRMILGRLGSPGLERHLILSSGGRWRICDPSADTKACR